MKAFKTTEIPENPVDPMICHIARYVELTKQERDGIERASKLKTLRKNQFLFSEGEVCSHYYFVTAGMLKLSHFHRDRELIVQFALKQNWISDWYSLVGHTESRFNLCAIEKTTVLAVHCQALNELCDRFPRLEKYFRCIVMEALAYHQNRVACIQKPAEDSYAELVANYAGLEAQVSQRQIASFIGITRESLSRIRHQSLSRLKSS
jgi:CRP-like cAMP-binding protein